MADPSSATLINGVDVWRVVETLALGLIAADRFLRRLDFRLPASRREDQRIDQLGAQLTSLHQKASDFGDDMQTKIGDIAIRLAVIEDRLDISHQRRHED